MDTIDKMHFLKFRHKRKKYCLIFVSDIHIHKSLMWNAYNFNFII